MDAKLLTFFHADFGKEFPSRNLWRGPSWNCPFPSSALCPLLYRKEDFSRAKICRKKGRKRGGQQKGQKGKKDAWKQVRLITSCFSGVAPHLTTPAVKALSQSKGVRRGGIAAQAAPCKALCFWWSITATARPKIIAVKFPSDWNV